LASRFIVVIDLPSLGPLVRIELLDRKDIQNGPDRGDGLGVEIRADINLIGLFCLLLGEHEEHVIDLILLEYVDAAWMTVVYVFDLARHDRGEAFVLPLRVSADRRVEEEGTVIDRQRAALVSRLAAHSHVWPATFFLSLIAAASKRSPARVLVRGQ